MEKIQNKFRVVANEKLCPRFYRLSLDAKSLVKAIKPGQFIHIRVKDSLEPFFRRPFSVYRANKTADIFYEAIGPGTKILSEKKKGDELDILGPLGNSFSLPPKGTKTVVMVAGGIGVAPFLIFSDSLKNKGYDLILLYGARTKGHTFNMKDFKKNGCKVYVATDDGSVGVKGRVSQLFSKIPLDPKTTFLYTCGPNPMMAAVQAFAKENNLAGQASCEEVMACALGACLGCSIETTGGYKTVCYDGPVFDLQEVKFH
ncbi:MAG: dihydroorotate dehydrogenase electron transfer subunit [Candidatus Omnitrophica bacterium]|nr:dihydroorotate dehydrogenase electron transfer subunit [Candidatus Omnitrophota bacterium]